MQAISGSPAVLRQIFNVFVFFLSSNTTVSDLLQIKQSQISNEQSKDFEEALTK